MFSMHDFFFAGRINVYRRVFASSVQTFFMFGYGWLRACGCCWMRGQNTDILNWFYHTIQFIGFLFVRFVYAFDSLDTFSLRNPNIYLLYWYISGQAIPSMKCTPIVFQTQSSDRMRNIRSAEKNERFIIVH